ELPRPAEPVARGQWDLGGDGAAGLGHVPAQVAAGDVDEDVADEAPALVADRRRRGRERDLGELAERHLDAVGSGDEHVAERVEIAPPVAAVADVDRVALAALDGL